MISQDKTKVDYSALAISKLESLCRECKQVLYELRFKKSSKNLSDTSLISKKKKQIARLKTEISMKLKQEVSIA